MLCKSRSMLFVLCLFSAIDLPCSGQEKQTDVKPSSQPKRIFLIGNSLTWDTVPSKLDGSVSWHVDCGKSLKYIRDNPEKPCVKSSTLWPQALKDKQFDILSVQPHYGTTLHEDVEVIHQWMQLQPQAEIVIHTGWAKSATRDSEFAQRDPTAKLFHGDDYFDRLTRRLRQKNPNRVIRSTCAMNLLNTVATDIKNGAAPIDSIESLYRDAIHMTIGGGRYLMHNAMRRALGQPQSKVGFEKVPDALRSYLDSKLSELPATAERSKIVQPK